jgi:hypothetical protein
VRSLAEILAEKVGYALAAVVLGPPAAMARRERRAMRAALDAWCEGVGAIRLEVRGVRARSGKLQGAAGSFPFEATLDAFHELASLDVAIEKLPPQASVTISKVRGRGVHATSPTLDASIMQALVRDVSRTALGARETFSLDLDGERIVLHVEAPREPAEWKALGEAMVAFAESCARRWGGSYR